MKVKKYYQQNVTKLLFLEQNYFIEWYVVTYGIMRLSFWLCSWLSQNSFYYLIYSTSFGPVATNMEVGPLIKVKRELCCTMLSLFSNLRNMCLYFVTYSSRGNLSLVEQLTISRHLNCNKGPKVNSASF